MYPQVYDFRKEHTGDYATVVARSGDRATTEIVPQLSSFTGIGFNPIPDEIEQLLADELGLPNHCL